MTAFEKAWDITKRYIPGWRNEVRDKGLLEHIPFELFTALPFGSEVFIDDERDDIDAWELFAKPEKYHDFLGAGTRVAAFKHPLNTNYAVKMPYETEWSLKQYRKRNQSDELIEALERLGYPIVGELQSPDWAGGVFNVQPRLEGFRAAEDSAKFGNRDKLNEEYSVAHNTLVGLFGDRHKANFGIDSLGNARLIDPEYLGGENWSDYVESPKEWQNFIGEQGIQHPASQLIDIIDVLQDSAPDVAYRRKLGSVRNFMEAIEPHSDNPKTLTIEGRPKYLEGY